MANARAWYQDGYNLSNECRKDGISCDGWDYDRDTDCDCMCHAHSAPFFVTNDDVAEWHKQG